LALDALFNHFFHPSTSCRGLPERTRAVEVASWTPATRRIRRSLQTSPISCRNSKERSSLTSSSANGKEHDTHGYQAPPQATDEDTAQRHGDHAGPSPNRIEAPAYLARNTGRALALLLCETGVSRQGADHGHEVRFKTRIAIADFPHSSTSCPVNFFNQSCFPASAVPIRLQPRTAVPTATGARSPLQMCGDTTPVDTPETTSPQGVIPLGARAK